MGKLFGATTQKILFDQVRALVSMFGYEATDYHVKYEFSYDELSFSKRFEMEKQYILNKMRTQITCAIANELFAESDGLEYSIDILVI